MKTEVRVNMEGEKVSRRNENVGKEFLLIFYAHYNDARALEYLAKNRWI